MSEKQKASTDYTLCILCQEDTKDELECPAKTKRADIGLGYKTLENDLKAFQEFNALPQNIIIDSFNDGNGIAATLLTNAASWHKSCRVKFSKTKLERLRKRSAADKTLETPSSPKQPRRRNDSQVVMCIICDKAVDTSDKYCRSAATIEIDTKVRTCATDLGDKKLLANLAAGDMVAIEAKYHANCLTSLYKKHQKLVKRGDEGSTDKDDDVHSTVFAELIAYMEEARSNKDKTPVSFKLADLEKLYKSRLEAFNIPTTRVHTTRLKERILSQCPDIKAQKRGVDILLMYDEDIAEFMQKACTSRNNLDSEAMHLSKASQIIRQDIFQTRYSFNGSFSPNCQERSIPRSLQSLISMILEGPNIKSNTTAPTQPALTIAQMTVYNCVKHTRSDTSQGKLRHSSDRETPLPLYTGLSIHALTRKKTLIDIFFELGMSVSYDRVLQVLTQLANGVCRRFEVEGVVCPPNLRKGLFTIGAIDNIDHDPTSTTSQGSFHGTSISLFQHTEHDKPGEDRGITYIDPNASQDKVLPLPDTYTDVPPAALTTKNPKVPQCQGPVMADGHFFSTAMNVQKGWLHHVQELLKKDKLESEDYISWAAYHASLQPPVPCSKTLYSLLPLFYEHANTVEMIKHGMDVVRQAIEHLHEGQTPVLAMDQPLYAIAKQVQWQWPATYGEDNFVIMFGGLHIEMAAFRTLGMWLQDSGWTQSLVNAGVATSGTADSFLKASHLMKTRHSHQITAAALSVLQQEAYDACTATVNEADKVEFEVWRKMCCENHPQFHYWHLTLSLELTVLALICAQREGDFQLYVDCLGELVQWFFALDQTHYSRWIPVHIRDLMQLHRSHPGVVAEFMAGNFVVNKTENVFSSIAIDQAHEQNNALVKGAGGAVGLTENPSAFRRWMVAGPEVARLMQEFEGGYKRVDHTKDFRHHEQVLGVQEKFAKDVRSLVSSIREMGNPFMDKSDKLVVLHTNDILPESVVETVQNIKKIGEQQYKTFVKERLERPTKAILDTIPRNNLALLSVPKGKQTSKDTMKMADLKNDYTLFSNMFIACVTRNSDLNEFFKHENHAFPPSLSEHGNLYSNHKKADLLVPLTSDIQVTSDIPEVQVKIFDGPAVVHFLPPRAAVTFQEYATAVFIPYLEGQLQNAVRGDIVWDVYNTQSLKSQERTYRGRGVRRRVTATTKIPKNWQDFLLVDENKEELFSFLSSVVVKNPPAGKEIYATDKLEVLCNNQDADLQHLAPCYHEEADTRVILHAYDAAKKGAETIQIRTVDTDIVVLCVAFVQKLGVAELWVAFGTGEHFRYLPAHEIAASLGRPKCEALPMFHAFTGCDTVSCFVGKGKKTAWDTWKADEAVTDTFRELSVGPDTITPDHLVKLENYVVHLYDKSSSYQEVNMARKHLFTKKGRTHKNIPPTHAALLQHVKRAVYQGHIWSKSLIPDPQYPSPANWGWQKHGDGEWVPVWTLLPEAMKALRELKKCQCKTSCSSRSRCGCAKEKLKCTPSCNCVCEDI